MRSPLFLLAILGAIFGLGACAPQTGLVLEVDGPDSVSSVEAGVVALKLVVAHASFCDRWISDTNASKLEIDVRGRDLTADPLTILVTPDKQTGGIEGYNDEQPDPLLPMALALGGDGQLLGVASFGPQPFVYEQVRKYSAHIELYQRTDATYLASDGCLCAPGLPLVGNASQTGCDTEIPPSFARLADTAGCELAAGASLPLGVCDGRAYPTEKQNRDLPCFATVAGACHVGRRVCNDVDGVAYSSECLPDASSATEGTSSLCDAYLGCEKMACGDPLSCLKASATRKTIACTLPVAADPVNGASAMCANAEWTFAFAAATTTDCTATMLDGTRQGALTIGWQKDASTAQPQLVATACPPTFVVGSVSGDPSKLPAQQQFAVSIGEQIYDVTVTFVVGCGSVADSLHCSISP